MRGASIRVKTSSMAKRIGNKICGSGSSAKRSASTGRFVLGRAAFASISAVEGIKISKSMGAALRRTAGMAAQERRSMLASKYGKK
jgi:hypothetical protein